jgi:hypothetical protein
MYGLGAGGKPPIWGLKGGAIPSIDCIFELNII